MHTGIGLSAASCSKQLRRLQMSFLCGSVTFNRNQMIVVKSALVPESEAVATELGFGLVFFF